MLPGPARMRRREDFSAAVRRGARAGRPLLSGHLLVRAGNADPPRAGLIVSKAVGSAVIRNRVRRRLRPVVAAWMRSLPAGSLLVVRAHPQAATARQSDLAADLDLVIGRLLRRQVGTPNG